MGFPVPLVLLSPPPTPLTPALVGQASASIVRCEVVERREVSPGDAAKVLKAFMKEHAEHSRDASTNVEESAAQPVGVPSALCPRPPPPQSPSLDCACIRLCISGVWMISHSTHQGTGCESTLTPLTPLSLQ
jgi:hypothetical protein